VTRVLFILGTWGALVAFSHPAFTQAPAPSPSLVRLTSDGHFKQRPMWSPDGSKLIFARHKGGKIGLAVLSADGSKETALTDGKLPQYDGCWSPDGKRLAFSFCLQSGPQGNLDVYLADADGSNPVKLAGDRGKLSHEEFPAWSPDGKQIAYSSTADGNQELYIADVEGPQRRRITSDPALDTHPVWSRDGKWLAFATNRWGDFEIALVRADGTELRRLTESPGLDDYPIISPDGQKIAFTSNRDGNYEVYVMNADGSGAVNVSASDGVDHFPAWTPDGRLTFVSDRDGGFEIYVTARP
jgi:TolB protein